MIAFFTMGGLPSCRHKWAADAVVGGMSRGLMPLDVYSRDCCAMHQDQPPASRC